MDKLPTKILIFAGLAVIAIGVFTVIRPADRQNSPPTWPVLASDPTPNPSQVTTVLSPDGKVTLVMKEKKDEEAVTHTFVISSNEDGVSREIFVKTLPQETGLTIPYNAFSPDNKYFFLAESAPTQKNWFVVSASGLTFGEGIQTLDVSSPFREKYTDYTIADVTGWGGVNLVVINTEKSTGGRGPSFWFDVGSRSYIQLSHTF